MSKKKIKSFQSDFQTYLPTILVTWCLSGQVNESAIQL